MVPSFVTVQLVSQAKKHALSAYPNEACGLVVDGKYVRCRNIAQNPTEDFVISDEDVLRAGDGLQAVVHSHPNASARPTECDMRGQVATAVPWAVLSTDGTSVSDPVWWGDFRLDEPLIGRNFIHGVSDCYSLIRSWYWQNRGVVLPEFPRDDEWWHAGHDLYRTGFEKAGFEQISHSEVRHGDVYLTTIISPRTNHGGIVLENGLLLHHLPHRLSREEPLGPWVRRVDYWLRYVK